MFNPKYIFDQLEINKSLFENLFSGISDDLILFQPGDGKWCLLEIVCHLLDEEREDFRARLQHVLNSPEAPLPSIDPQTWVKSRDYIHQDFQIVLANFLEERKHSVDWLRSLENPDWNRYYQHPKFGPMSAKLFLSNWLAHDFLHIRQILFTKHVFLGKMTGENLKYAGEW